MKRIISVALLSIVIAFSMIVSAYAEQATSTATGFTNIPFSNGYYGFCIDRDLKGAYTGDGFTSASSTSVANNNVDNKDVSQKLKILFTQCFEDIFVSDNNGGYVVDSVKADSSLPYAIYNITDNQYVWGESANFIKVVNEYQGPEIPDDGYTLQLDNGDFVIFSFVVMEPQQEGQQSFFAYKLTVSQGATHKCEFGDEWKSDDENHWHECECGKKSDEGEHNGNTADCVNPSVCETCKKELAGVDKNKHTGNTVVKNAKPATEFEDGYTGDVYCEDCGKLISTGEIIPATHKCEFGDEWKSDDENHWHECECGKKSDEGEHNGNTADCVNPSVCETCKKELAGVDKNKHTGNTVVKNAKPATEFEDGYTGDIYCEDCGKLISTGEIIPATHKCEFGDEWKSDDENHWHECECGKKSDEGEHNGNTADCVNPSVCETCKKELAGVDKNKHTGNTVVKNAKPATEFEDGYTGDIYCEDCGKLISTGEIIPATHKCEFGDEWKSDDENHWHECECGKKSDEGTHKFSNGICSVCGLTVSIADEKTETNSDLDPIFDFVSGVVSSVDFDYISGLVSDMDLVVDFNYILELIPDFSSGGKQDNADDESVNTEIPDTGSESKVAIVFVILLLSLVTLTVTVFSKKKYYTK